MAVGKMYNYNTIDGILVEHSLRRVIHLKNKKQKHRNNNNDIL
jgi:hypothetical protein